MKENFDRFISCKNTIDDIHVRLRRTEAEANSTAGVMEAVAESHGAATEVGTGFSHTFASCAPDSLVACHSPKLNAVHGGRRRVAQRNERGACLSGHILSCTYSAEGLPSRLLDSTAPPASWRPSVSRTASRPNCVNRNLQKGFRVYS